MAAVQVVLQALRHLVAQANHNKYIETEGATGVSAPACLGVFALTFVPQASRPSQLIIGTCRRPPGHHAGSSVCGGYCFFNNVAIAAKCLQHETARATSEVPKVAILDIDYHHGNGSEYLRSVLKRPTNSSVKRRKYSTTTRPFCMFHFTPKGTIPVSICLVTATHNRPHCE